MTNLGGFQRLVERPFRLGALCAVAILCGRTPVWAFDPPRPEAGSCSIDAFAERDGDARLPPELLAPPAGPYVLPEAGGQGPVELLFTAHEHAGFRGYRLTARIEDGPLSGLATQWGVAPGRGRRDDASGAYAYRVPLNLPVFTQTHVRAALEGVALASSDSRNAARLPASGSEATRAPPPARGRLTESLFGFSGPEY